jgi:NAD kinase
MSQTQMAPRVVVVTRPTEYEALVARHGTREQARFVLATYGDSIEAVERRHEQVVRAVGEVTRSIPVKWRHTRVARADLNRFVFEPETIVVAVGQDGLVANAAKYLFGQQVIGINPDPSTYDGILVPHRAERAGKLMLAVAAGRSEIENRTMVEARAGDGQRLVALNEIFAGHRSHQSARYRIRWGEWSERQSSSGIVVATGTGATGWARSISRERREALELPVPSAARLAFFVREAFPSIATGTSVTSGLIGQGEAVELLSEMNDGGVLFGDGIEDDRLEFSFGMTVRVAIAEQRLHLVR